MATHEGAPTAVKVGVHAHKRTSSIESPVGFSLHRLSVNDGTALGAIKEVEGGDANSGGKNTGGGTVQPEINPFLQEPGLEAPRADVSNLFAGVDAHESQPGNLADSRSSENPFLTHPGQAPALCPGSSPLSGEEQRGEAVDSKSWNPFQEEAPAQADASGAAAIDEVEGDPRRAADSCDAGSNLGASLQEAANGAERPDSGIPAHDAMEASGDRMEESGAPGKEEMVGTPGGLRINTKSRTQSAEPGERFSFADFAAEHMGNGGQLRTGDGNYDSMFSPGALTSVDSMDLGLEEQRLFELELSRREAENEVAQLRLQLKSKTTQLEQVQEVLLTYEEEIMKLKQEMVENSSTRSATSDGEDGRGHSRTASSVADGVVSVDTAEALSSKIVELQGQVQDLEEELIKSKLANVQLQETNEFMRAVLSKASKKQGKGVNIFSRNRTSK